MPRAQYTVGGFNARYSPLPGSRGHYITPWDCLSYRGPLLFWLHYYYFCFDRLDREIFHDCLPPSFEDEPLLSLHFRVVLALKLPLLKAPVANAQSSEKQADVFSQRLLFSPNLTFVAVTFPGPFGLDDISHFLFKLKIASLTNPPQLRLIISSDHSLMVVSTIQLQEHQLLEV